MSQRKIFIVAGEASGDAHAARLIRALKTLDPNACIEGLGGEKMKEAGCLLRADLASSAVMGFWQVAKKLPYFRRLLAETRLHVQQSRPDALLLVDYPGFNLRLAETAKKANIPVIYYISPQVWAWRPKRIHKIARIIDKMLVILPFEEQLYRNLNVDVAYVGHPLLDGMEESGLDEAAVQGAASEAAHTPVFGLLPGSRIQEIRTNLPIMLETAELILKQFPRAKFLIPCSNRVNLEFVQSLVGPRPLPVTVSLGNLHGVIRASRCCIVASGTATLETACLLTPLIVVYRTNPLAWFIGQRLLNVSHISLVNILAGAEVVPEMLQSKMRPNLLAELAVELSRDNERRGTMIHELRQVREKLGKPGASLRAAGVVWEILNKTQGVETTAA